MMTEDKTNSKTLAELIPDDMFIGTSLLLREESESGSYRFLYGMRSVKEENNQLIYELTGIGGKLEKSDDSPGAGAIREAQEEMACAVQLVTSSKTLLIQGYNDVRLIEVAGPEKPLAIIFRHHQSPAHSPWHQFNKGKLCLVLFEGKIQGQPRPVSELPRLIWLPARLVLECSRRDVPLGELLLEGAALVPGHSGSPPLDGLARMTDSHEALALALGEKLFPLLGELDLEKFASSYFVAADDGSFLLEEAGSTVSSTGNEPEADADISHLLVEGDMLLSTIINDGIDEATENQEPEETELEAQQELLKNTRQEIKEATMRIEHLLERTAAVEQDLESLKESQANPNSPLSRLWQKIWPNRRLQDK